jgi:hypothetical protein
MPIVLVNWETEIWRLMIPGQPEEKVSKTLAQPIAGYISMYLSSHVHGRLKSRSLLFQAS